MRLSRFVLLLTTILLASIAVLPFLQRALAQEQKPAAPDQKPAAQQDQKPAAQDQKPAAQETKPPALPLPEMQRLSKLYVGAWTYTETYPKSPMTPQGGVNTGVYISELGPGGNSIFNHFRSQGPVGNFEGTLVMTWDARENAYKAYAFGDGFPGAIVETGQFEGDTLVFHAELPMGAKKISLRNVTTFSPDNKIVSEEYASSEGGPEGLLVRVEAVKK
jgi:hypothetical protein